MDCRRALRWAAAALIIVGVLALVGGLEQTLSRAGAPCASPAECSRPAADGVTATLSLPTSVVTPGSRVKLPLHLQLPAGELYAADVILSYDPVVVSATQVTRGILTHNWGMAVNRSEPGQVRVALAAAEPVNGGGELLLFAFDPVSSYGSTTTLGLSQGDLNEGGIPAHREDGQLDVCHPADVDCNCIVDADDLAAMATAWRSRPSEWSYESRYDQDADGTISVVDIMEVASAWGWSCGSGEATAYPKNVAGIP